VILVATDLTDLDRLMPHALEQAVETGAGIILFHVVGPGAAMAVDAAGLPYYDPSGALEFFEQPLQTWCASARMHGVSCEALVCEGNPAQQIASTIGKFHADRLIVGTRSRGRLGKLLIGSVAEHVLRSVDLPVITVGPVAHLPSQAPGESHSSASGRVVLHATLLGEASHPSAALACQIAAEQKAKLILLHVLPPIDEMERKGLPTGIDSAAMHELRALAVRTGTGCCGFIEPMVAHGNPAIEILAASAECEASLIVLGATHRSAFENLTRDRTIYRVLAHARCPVLTLRQPVANHDESAVAHAASGQL
jgi:nucleotide-binding universal stress UspA family protein